MAQPEPAAPRRPSPSVLIVVGLLAIGVVAVLVFLLGRPPGPVSQATSVPTVTPAAAAPTNPPATDGPTPAATPSGVLTITTPTPLPTRPPTARPTATANTNPTIVSFTAPSTVQCTGNEVRQITLSWRVERASGVSLSIDGPGKYADYPAVYSVEVPFACSEAQHTYRITTIGGTGPATRQEKTVRRS
jgi:hypothetical protein